MRLMFTHLLNCTLSPHMKLLLFLSMDTPFPVQIFKYDHIRLILPRIFCNRFCDLSGKLLIETLCIIPQSADIRTSVFSLEPSDPPQYPIQTVFFNRKIDKLSSGDSSVRSQNRADCIRIDPKIHTADNLIFYLCFRKCYRLCIRKPQIIPFVFLFQYRRACFLTGPVFS